MLLAAARSSFLKNCDAESELEGEDDERAILKLAFLMQFRNKVRSAQFFLHLARRVPSEMKIVKSRGMLVLGRPGGMRGGAGGRFEGG